MTRGWECYPCGVVTDYRAFRRFPEGYMRVRAVQRMVRFAAHR